ncbi:non-ribosomal peptide synthetase [Amycolatopsis taiwanensis]|uniref:Amino acid adenylation protein n=1 Tax=Amycolatopsis taiwanensis TaxID=342230 RepID=A0A9W6VIT9_9PSEU|nr:non-ribosomal peptide synthetase [Amycolatopsis taiwanensis]GLY70040.1 amino acid adenylation protein [Amycolatopsis taiwanensis]
MTYGVAALVSQWCAKTPDAQAVSVAATGESVTYRELWARSGRLAAELMATGVRPGEVVGIALDRSVELVVAMLGVVRAGAVYLSLDAEAPESRVAELLTDVHCVLTGPRRAVPDSVRGMRVPTTGDASADVAVSMDDPCYVVYTSGSTGRPKGVLIPHRGVVRLVREPVFCTLNPGDRLACTANPAFDAITFEVWGGLARGATVVMFPDVADLGLDAWVALVSAQRLHALHLTTSVFNLVAKERPVVFGPLRTLLFGGEQADPAMVRRVLAQAPPGRMVNLYGPTETTMLASWFECTPGRVPEGARVPIGFPIQDTTLSIVDEALRAVPPGEVGELLIGGPGVALGYLGMPELTAERFVPDPAGGRGVVYRTGDLVRAGAGGALEVIGRRDRQVKVRGFRVELDEVELAIRATGLVDTAVVEKVGDGPAAVLAGFVVPASADTGVLAARLAERLPAYLVPARWVPLAELPLQPTGKVDRTRLVRLAEDVATGDDPADGLAGEVGAVWREVLAVPSVGAGDNFLDLGGNSLLAVQVAVRLSERLAVEVEPADVLLADTFVGLVDQLRQAKEHVDVA